MRWVGMLIGLLTVVAIGLNVVAYTARAFAMRQVPDCDRDSGLGLFDAARIFVIECLCTIFVQLLIPVGWLMRPQAGGHSAQGPLVLVHGWGLNRGCWWLVRRRLLRDGWGPIYTFDYWSFTADIERAAARLREFLETKVEDARGQPLTLIGHSLGGLVIRYYLRRYRAAAVRRIVTLGTPHLGTLFLPLPGPVRQRLSPDSTLLKQLNAADRVPHQFDVIAFASLFDALILPPTNARYPEAFNVQVRDVGHNQLLFSRRIYDLLKENLEAPMRAEGFAAKR
jgi:pimeloyl-ACP methyl ester carboxylesterase